VTAAAAPGHALIAGVGNIFLGDDGFGVAVSRRLQADRRARPGVEIVDFGIRGLHLTYALLEPCDLLVVIDALPRGGPPGTLYLFEPRLPDAHAPVPAPDGHGLDVAAVLAAVRALGGALPRVLIVGCEPRDLGEGLGLSPPVAAAVGPAADMVLEILGSHGQTERKEPSS
jgi:hydrogenase maturation protease